MVYITWIISLAFALGDGKLKLIITLLPFFVYLLFLFMTRGYIVFGIGTVLIGILTFFYLVDDTHHKLLRLTEKELEIVEERTRDNCVVRVKEVKTEQMWEAMNEPRLYLIFFMNLFNCLQNGGLVTFSTLLVQGLGFSVSDILFYFCSRGIIP